VETTFAVIVRSF